METFKENLCLKQFSNTDKVIYDMISYQYFSYKWMSLILMTVSERTQILSFNLEQPYKGNVNRLGNRGWGAG